MKIYFHIDQARKTYVTAYLTLRTESNKHEKLRVFWEEIVMVYIMIVLLDQCCLAENIVMCCGFFHEFDEMAGGRKIFHLNITIILW